MHRSRTQVAEELSACIGCNECLLACPALPTEIPIESLNRETLADSISLDVARFAHACYQCGACVPVCPVGLHRDAMMFWLKMRLAGGKGSTGSTGSNTSAAGGRRRERASRQDGREDRYDGRATPWR